MLWAVVIDLINSKSFIHYIPNFYWLFRKDHTESCFRNKLNFFEKKYFWMNLYMRERHNCPLSEDPIYAYLYDGTFDLNMTSSKIARTYHHICSFYLDPRY